MTMKYNNDPIGFDWVIFCCYDRALLGDGFTQL